MIQVNYYQVNVTILQDVEGHNGEVKQKKVQEIYIVKSDSPESAINLLKEDFSTCPFEWSVKSMKVIKLSGIIE